MEVAQQNSRLRARDEQNDEHHKQETEHVVHLRAEKKEEETSERKGMEKRKRELASGQPLVVERYLLHTEGALQKS